MIMYRFYLQVSAVLENCFYVEANRRLNQADLKELRWIFSGKKKSKLLKTRSFFPRQRIVEIGPRLTMETPDSSNACQMCKSIRIKGVTRVEYTRRFVITKDLPKKVILEKHLDEMTQQVYPDGITTFVTGVKPVPVRIIEVIEKGKQALIDFNNEFGLNWDDSDIERLYSQYTGKEKRNPTDVELFDDANCNGDHSRHRFWKGVQVINDISMPRTLMEIAQAPLQFIRRENPTSDVTLVAFKDNAGVIQGFRARVLRPENPGRPSRIVAVDSVEDYTLTAETHNWPTYVSPDEGGGTGRGGRDRDNNAVGRGARTGAGTAGLAVGNLFIDGYDIPGEVAGKGKLSDYASPLRFLIEGSDGASDDGNRRGEPLIGGFIETFGQTVNGEWIEYRKGILYSGGIGTMPHEQLFKAKPEKGMVLVAIGGPAYRIGFGGARSSGANTDKRANTRKLDLNSVQRANGEMANKTCRVIGTCIDLGPLNPIASLHDQGAGGPANVLKELMEPAGGRVNIRKIVSGDTTLSVAEIWNAEYQERYGLLIYPNRLKAFKNICKRERVNCEVLGEITGDGRVVVYDPRTKTTPVNLNLADVLGALPQKVWKSDRAATNFQPLKLPRGLTIAAALEAVFKLPSVGSKGHFVNKADRSVGGRVVLQQCCGIAQVPVADCGVLATSFLDQTGAVESIGLQPIIMLIDPKAGARMAHAEMLTNMAGVKIPSIGNIRCQINWMGPVKYPGEGARVYDAATAGSELMIALGYAQNGGKDSGSLATKVQGELVKSPLTMVVKGIAAVPDITKIVTPDIKQPGNSLLGLIDLGCGKNRLGGSALAQVHNQIGDEVPDVDSPQLLNNAWCAVQEMVDKDLILAIHDRSGGGAITTIAEMCMASGCGFNLELKSPKTVLTELFNQELGWVVEFSGNKNHRQIMEICRRNNVPFETIGSTSAETTCKVDVGSRNLFEADITQQRVWWERPSFELEKLHRNPACALIEYAGHRYGATILGRVESYRLTFQPDETPTSVMRSADKPRVAVLREEGTNGDEEMRAAFTAAGFEVWDIHMSDLLAGTFKSFSRFQGLVFPGGFSYMDTCGSGRGWAATILFNERLRKMFADFFARTDTFSLGVCNGFQFQTLMGLLPCEDIADAKQPRLELNTSWKFELRWVQTEIRPSPATKVFFKDMVGSRLGVWVAHGEGRLVYPDESIERMVERQNLAPLVYIDPDGKPTETYPYNPNGSAGGITALCSPNGRHLGMMPHPERCFLLSRWPWMPAEWKKTLKASPWLRMFQNARDWCVEHRE